MLHLLCTFARFDLSKFGKYFKTRTLAKLITVGLFFIVFLFVGSGIYFFFMTGFRYISIEAVPDIKDALTLFLYEVFLLALVLVGSISALVTGVFSLFRGEQTSWLMSTPGYRVFPHVVFMRSFFASLLPSLILFIPTVFAFAKSNHLSIVPVIVVLVSIVLLLGLVSGLVMSGIVLVSAGLRTLAQKYAQAFTLRSLILILVLIVALVTTYAWNAVRDIDLVKLFKADVATDVLATTTVAEHFSLFPTHLVAMEILMLQNHNNGAWVYLGLLVLLTGLVLMLWVFVSRYYFAPWLRLQEGNRVPVQGTMSSRNAFFSDMYTFSHGRTLALFSKEALVFTRNFKGMMWSLFLMILWFLQIATNSIVSKNLGRYGIDVNDKLTTLTCLQFIIAIYFMSSFTLRFAFPSFSVEKKTSWILRSAPLSLAKIFYGKLCFYGFFFSILGLMMSYTSVYVLSIPISYALGIMTLFISTTLCIVTFGLSIGALFPNEETDDAESITTSMPGLFFTALSLLYGALAATVLYYTLKHSDFTYVSVYMLGTGLMTLSMLFFVPRYLMRHKSETL